MKKHVFILSFLLLSAQQAQALTVDAAGAARLKESLSPDIAVTPAGDHYAVTLPGATLATPFGTAFLGNFPVKATPAANDAYLLETTLPSPLALLDEAKKPAATATLGKQRLSCLWQPKTQTCEEGIIELEGVRVVPEGLQDPSYTLDSFHGRLTMEHPVPEKTTVRLKGDLAGQHVYSVSPPVFGLIPSTGTFNALLEGVPTAAFAISSLGDALDASLKAGAVFTISDTSAASRDLGMTLSGKLGGDTREGRLTLAVKGLDELFSQTKNMSPDALPYFATLTALQMAGQSGTSPEGKSLRTYTLTYTPEGKVMLNGASLEALFPPPAAPAGK